MTRIGNLEEAEQILASYMPQARELLGKDLTLKRMEPLMAALGNPESKLKIIHVAGTSGKTSTAYYISSLLQMAGQKIGLTVSPHIDSVTERVQINLEPLPEALFCEELSKFLDLVEDVEPRPTYFELMIAFVYWYFAKAKVDYAVIETGLGGSFDATNVAGNGDKVCVITDIGFDHTQVLGKKLTEIAGQKAGIIYASNQVFMNQQSPAVMDVFQHKTTDENATLNVLSNSSEDREVIESGLAKIPAYQRRNWLLAKAVYGFVAKRDSLPLLDDQQLQQSMEVQVPGRMEARTVRHKTVIMDGAHNEQKMQAFVSSFSAQYPGQKASVLLALKEGKEYEAVLPLLLPICSQLVITSFETAQDLPISSHDPTVLAQAAKALGFPSVHVEPDCTKAFQELLVAKNKTIVVTGSFYLLSSLRPYILEGA